MPSAPMASSSRASSITSCVLYPPAPASTGTLPLASSRLISTTRRCSACVSVGLSPVVPQGTRKLMPAWICRRTRRRSVASSRERSRWNGVTNAVPHPVNMYHLLWRRGRAGRRAPLIKTLFADNPLRGFQRASGEAFAAAGGVAERDGISGTVESDLVGAWDGAGTVAAHVDVARIAGLFHLVDQLE